MRCRTVAERVFRRLRRAGCPVRWSNTSSSGGSSSRVAERVGAQYAASTGVLVGSDMQIGVVRLLRVCERMNRVRGCMYMSVFCVGVGTRRGSSCRRCQAVDLRVQARRSV